MIIRVAFKGTEGNLPEALGPLEDCLKLHLGPGNGVLRKFNSPSKPIAVYPDGTVALCVSNPAVTEGSVLDLVRCLGFQRAA